jgi:undecaprenyl-diphosphatase
LLPGRIRPATEAGELWLAMNALLAVLGELDARLLEALLLRRRPLLDRVMRSVTRLADPYLPVAVACALARAPLGALREAGALAMGTLVLSHLLVQVAKRAATRPRPALPFEALIRTPPCFSFPSGHAAAGLSVALPVALALPGAAGLLVLGVGVLVGVSRCYLGVHYPGDVLAGWILAAASWGLLVTF